MYRKSAGLSYTALAERLGVSEQTVEAWETGASLLDVDALIALAAALQIEPVELMGDKRVLLEFALTKKRRVRTAIVLGALWAVALALMLFLLPYLKWSVKMTGNWDLSIAYRICYCTVQPTFYALTTAFFASLLAVRGDFRIENKAFRAVLLVLGFAWIVIYGCFIGPMPVSMFIYDHFGLFGVWCWENPALFVIPGALLFCGFNWKPSAKRREESV